MADMYMRNIRDWREGTIMLTFEEKGYYDELLNLIYLHDDLLPDNDALICRSMPVHTVTHRRLKQRLIDAGLIDIKNGFYRTKRASMEINRINELSIKNRTRAESRWSKSLKNKESGDAAAMLKVKVNSESEDLKLKTEDCENAEKPGIQNHGKKQGCAGSAKCTIDQVLDPEGKIPEDYLAYAKQWGIGNPQRRFLDWAGWWLGENGRKAGARGWLQTWKSRVRKDADRQLAAGGDKQGSKRDRASATTDGARLALDRRRNRSRTI
ncbi:MAG: DUF1376 domain-containing protein [Emcibacteraceae bacterium]